MKKFIIKNKYILMPLFFIPIVAILLFVIGEFLLHLFDLKAGDWALFIEAFLGYYGTLVLTTLALSQNEAMNKLNKRMLENEIKNSSTPFFNINEATISSEYKLDKDEMNIDKFEYTGEENFHKFDKENNIWRITANFYSNTLLIGICFKNIGEGVAKDFNISFNKINGIKIIEDWDAIIGKEETYTCHFEVNLEVNLKEMELENVMTITYKNIYDYKYRQEYNIYFATTNPFAEDTKVVITA